MSGKVISFDKGEDRLLDLAERYSDEKNYRAALRMIYKKMSLYGTEPDDWMFLAELYDDMEVYESAINCWYRFLNICPEENIADAYEGLAACYYNVGNESQSAYYYSKMLAIDPDVTPESKLELAKMFTHSPRKMFKVIYPPEKADYSDSIEIGVELLKKGKYTDAIRTFSRVHPESFLAATAQNYRAVCYLISGDKENAEKECLSLLEKDPEDVQALSTYCALMVEKKELERSREIANRLCELETNNPDELYKIATVCCESGLHYEAYKKFCSLEGIVDYDLTLLYFKAVAAYKAGMLRECKETFLKLLDVFPYAEVARYYYNELRAEPKEGEEKRVELSYFYKVPTKERESRIKLLAVLLDLPDKEIRAYKEKYDLIPVFRWCFDEFDGQEAELQMLAVNVAVHARMESFIEEVLLSSTVNDIIKIETMHRLFEQNESRDVAFVLNDVYRVFRFKELDVGRPKRKQFMFAYSLCLVKFCVLGKERASTYNRIAAEVYVALSAKGLLEMAYNKEALAGTMHCMAQGKRGNFAKSAASLNTKEQAIRKIYDAVRGETRRWN